MDLRIRAKFNLLLALALGSVIFFLRPAFAYEYQVTDLGNLGGSPSGVSVRAYGINDSAQVVGRSNYNYNYNSYGFIWQNGSMTNLGELSPGSGHTYARDINGAGQVVGSSPYSTGGGGYGGFLWQNGSMTHLVGQGFWSEANAINNKGQVVGNSMAYNRLDSYGHLWDGGTRTDLGSLGGSFTFAEGINDQTQVVGWSMASDGQYYAFIWQNGAMVPIAGTGSKAYDIDNSGKVVGVSNSAAFLWVSGLTQSIGGPGSGAYAINENGEIVGWSGNNAVLWKDGQIINLNTLIPSDSGWVLAEATGISNNGYIIGNGFVNGDDQLHAFMISPVPEPSSLLLLTSGLFGLFGYVGISRSKS